MLFKALVDRITRREPDFYIGGDVNPYMRRWWVIPRNRWFNIYLHHFMRSDDDRALHDHPWVWCSIMLEGEYTEWQILNGGIHVSRVRRAGSVALRGPRSAHRVELHQGHCWTLFITGPVVRTWGFHCHRGWVRWTKFVASNDAGAVGAGCDQPPENLEREPR